MFTGLIQALGIIKLTTNSSLEVYCPEAPFLSQIAIGDSIAVDGICLTVETYDQQGFTVSISPETLSRSTLTNVAKTQAPVNLEPALRVGDKVGGHFVSGHVDGVGTVVEIINLDTSWELGFTAPEPVTPYIVPKGSITVNGVSLTVASCNSLGTYFTTAVIPHTYQATNLQFLQSGAVVNLEADLLGKYAAKLIRPHLAQAFNTEHNPESDSLTGITLEFLTEHGYS